MLDALSDALSRQIFETLAADRSHARADLDRLPPLVAHALRQRLDREAGTRLDEAAPWLSRTPEAWRDDALAGARFPADAWQPAVRETCHALVSTLVMPSEALPQQLIRTGAAPVADVLSGLKALGVYPYLAEIVRRYVEKKDVEAFDREAFGHLLARIDRRVAGELDADGWMALFAPLYDLVGGIPEQEGAVPGRVLAEAFAARGCPGLGREVVSETEVSRDALRGILAKALGAPLATDSGAEPSSAEPSGARLSAPKPPATPEAEVMSVEPESTALPLPAPEIEDADLVDDAPLAPRAKSEETDVPEADAPEADESESDAPEAHDSPEAKKEEIDAPEAESSSAFLAALIERDGFAGDDEPTDDHAEPGYSIGNVILSPDDEPPAEPDAPQEDDTEHSGEAGHVEPEPGDASNASGETGPGETGPTRTNRASTDPRDAASGDPLSAPITSLGDSPETRSNNERDSSPEPLAPEAEPESDGESETLLDRLARRRGQTLGTDEPLATPEPAAGDPLWKQFAHVGAPGRAAPTLHDAMRAPAPDAPLEVHETAVLGDAAANREWYTEHLFAGDAEAYGRVVAQLSASGSWTAATQIIGREIFRKNKVNMYSEPAVSFTNAVESRLRRD